MNGQVNSGQVEMGRRWEGSDTWGWRSGGRDMKWTVEDKRKGGDWKERGGDGKRRWGDKKGTAHNRLFVQQSSYCTVTSPTVRQQWRCPQALGHGSLFYDIQQEATGNETIAYTLCSFTPYIPVTFLGLVR